jgi:hypothetical protein
METVSIKERLIAQISDIDDNALLSEIQEWLDLEAVSDRNVVYQLSKTEELLLNEARESILAGDCLTEEEANREIDLWLGE